MTYKLLADAVVLIHFLWILFLFFGAYVGAKYRVARILHLSGLAFALITEIFGWYCPLTYLEVWLRSKHDPRWVYAGSFIVHYVEKIVYLELSRTLIVIGTVILVGFNVWFYRKRRERRTYSKRSAC
jgi:hypothetical protein